MTSGSGRCAGVWLESLAHRWDEASEAEVQPGGDDVGTNGGPVGSEVESAIRRARRGGQPLEGILQERMGTALGYDLRPVRVHTGPAADRLARQLGAQAFTIGPDIFFRQGAYEPASRAGRELIAHELVHVVQQAAGRPSTGRKAMQVRAVDDVFEQEAKSLAPKIVAAMEEGGSVTTAGAREIAMGAGPSWTAQGTLPVTAAKRTWHGGPERAGLQTLRFPQRHAHVIQRVQTGSIPSFVQAARNRGSHTVTSQRRALKPNNCHEAVLGWLLHSMGYPRRWRFLRVAAAQYGIGAGMGHAAAFTGTWMWNNIYNPFTAGPLTRATINTLQPGDIVFLEPNHPVHSMVVIAPATPNPAGGTRLNIRGFNNWGTFGGVPAYPNVPMQTDRYDNHDRDIGLPAFWNHPVGTLCGKLPVNHLYRMSYMTASRRVRQAFPYGPGGVLTTHLGPAAVPWWEFSRLNGWTYIGPNPVPSPPA